jgi:hypothetical protein
MRSCGSLLITHDNLQLRRSDDGGSGEWLRTGFEGHVEGANGGFDLQEIEMERK